MDFFVISTRRKIKSRTITRTSKLVLTTLKFKVTLSPKHCCKELLFALFSQYFLHICNENNKLAIKLSREEYK